VRKGAGATFAPEDMQLALPGRRAYLVSALMGFGIALSAVCQYESGKKSVECWAYPRMRW